MAENGQYVDGSIWFYAPNKGAPVFFAVGFAASGICHIYQCIHYHSWKLTGLYVTAAVLFTGGFITREIAAFDYGNLVEYIVAVVLVYAAPPLLELGNYQALGRILYYVPYYSPIHPGRVLTTFAIISAVVEALNSRGIAIAANSSLSESLQEQGRILLKCALVLQLAVVTLFLLLAGTFHRRVSRAGLLNHNLAAALHTLYASSIILLVRTIYRTIEYFELANTQITAGMNPLSLSPVVRYEWFFYVFEASLMLSNMVLLNVRHPRRFLPKSTKIYLSRDGVTEIEGPGYADKRHFLVTLVDPFDMYSLLRGRKKANFWEQEEGRGLDGGAGASDKGRPPDSGLGSEAV